MKCFLDFSFSIFNGKLYTMSRYVCAKQTSRILIIITHLPFEISIPYSSPRMRIFFGIISGNLHVRMNNKSANTKLNWLVSTTTTAVTASDNYFQISFAICLAMKK